MHFVSASCEGEACGICLREGGMPRQQAQATHKVGEEILRDDPNPARHNLTQYVCCWHYRLIVGPAAPCFKEGTATIMGNEQKVGIYDKYAVTRNDGTDGPGRKHEHCAGKYFVLDMEHDPYAKPAVLAYAAACEKTHPVLAADLREAAARLPFSGGRT